MSLCQMYIYEALSEVVLLNFVMLLPAMSLAEIPFNPNVFKAFYPRFRNQ